MKNHLKTFKTLFAIICLSLILIANLHISTPDNNTPIVLADDFYIIEEYF